MLTVIFDVSVILIGPSFCNVPWVISGSNESSLHWPDWHYCPYDDETDSIQADVRSSTGPVSALEVCSPTVCHNNTHNHCLFVFLC